MGDFLCFLWMMQKAGSMLLDISFQRNVDNQEVIPFPRRACLYRAVEGYLAKLVQLGEPVAICEQVGDPAHIKRTG